ncbi:MAG: MarR family transcriptional regulator [Firmicutes bacterium]|jgi:DNA-binding MarR family transcriptional regulator|nr:MarR family transcriptional regulator [Bacillota bacterium]
MNKKNVLGNLGKVKTKYNNKVNNELKDFELKGLCPSHGSILSALNENEKLTMKGISKLICKDKSTVTALVNKLIKLGYVSKHRCELDNRVSYITLTDEGHSVEKIFSNISGKLVEESFKDFTPDEIELLDKLLDKMVDNIR